MNGRALNEKAIEVSPSSHAVLDRAAEVLTPFPPSKNRPRPGDWTCPSCGFSNFQRRTACFRCSYPALPGGGSGDPNMAYGYGYQPPPPPNMMQNPSYNQPGRPFVGSAPFRPGDWRCPQQSCLYHNFAKNVNCLRCGTSRANAVIMGNPPNPSEFNNPPQEYQAYQMGGHDQHGPPGPGGPPPMGGFAGGPAPFGPYPGFGVPAGAPYPMAPGFPAPGGPPASGFDRAEAAFSSAGGNAGPGAPGPQGFSNGGPSGFEGQSDPFSFIGSSLSALSIDDKRGRNGAVGQGGQNQG